MPGASAGLTKSSLDPHSEEANWFPAKGSLPTTLRESLVGARVADSQYRHGDGRHPAKAVGCGGLEWQLHQRVLVTVAM